MRTVAEHIPIITTIFAILFFREIYAHYRSKPGRKYLLWWCIGVFTYGIGTFTESLNALFGWSEWNFRFWYISGALLGGFPLAQGSVHLLMSERFSRYSGIVVVSLIGVASVFILLSPIQLPEGFDGRLTGSVLGWKWVRTFSPFINLYAFLFLFGGAVYSAVLYARQGRRDARYKGNILIAIGALLPGIGGTFTRFGYVEVLYVTELIGLLLIYSGYRVIKTDSSWSVHANQLPEAA
jgi:hypothetical protein